MLTEERLRQFEQIAQDGRDLCSHEVFELLGEVRRLQQGERDLLTSAQLNEGLLDEVMKVGWPQFIRGSERNDR